MKLSKYLFLLLLSLCPTAFAQQQGGGQGPPQEPEEGPQTETLEPGESGFIHGNYIENYSTGSGSITSTLHENGAVTIDCDDGAVGYVQDSGPSVLINAGNNTDMTIDSQGSYVNMGTGSTALVSVDAGTPYNAPAVVTVPTGQTFLVQPGDDFYYST